MSEVTINQSVVAIKGIHSAQLSSLDSQGRVTVKMERYATAGKGNINRRVEGQSIDNFMNNRRRDFELETGKPVTTLEYCDRVLGAAKLKELYAKEQSDAQMNQKTASLLRTIKTTYSLDAAATLKHDEILEVLQDAARLFKATTKPAVKVVKANKNVTAEVEAKLAPQLDAAANANKSMPAPAPEVQQPAVIAQ